MYPVFLIFNSSLASTLLEYRYIRLPYAFDKAKGQNFSGALFPWESAFTGVECCPTWVNLLFKIDFILLKIFAIQKSHFKKAPEGVYEQHISGDIAIATMQYFYATKDKNWLVKFGFPLISSIAEFWASRVVYNESEQMYDIYNVIPPDEDAGIVNNSVYTNAIAKISIGFGVELYEMFGQKYTPLWKDIIQKMKIPFDQKLQIHLEYDGYSGTTIKQADVALLQYPLMVCNLLFPFLTFHFF